MTPLIEELEMKIKLKNLYFYKIDIDENCECVDNCEVKSIPKFSLYYNGSELDSVCGADIKAIGQMLNNKITNKKL